MSPVLTPPPVNGVHASRVVLPQTDRWTTVLDYLCARFAHVPPEQWHARMRRGRVLDAVVGVPLLPATPYRGGRTIFYYREVAVEPRIPFQEAVLHVDDDLVVVDKPHFLPVMPRGPCVEETLAARLVRRLGNPHLVPLHRIDRDTAGLVLFSANPARRDAYHALFRTRAISKHYLALAPALPTLRFPLVHRSRLQQSTPFFRMCETPGTPNSETRISVFQAGVRYWRYRLEPVTGRQHQLRVHMAALGAPILNDPLYPVIVNRRDDPPRPLQLLAQELCFVDPFSGETRRFESRRALYDEEP